MAVNIIKRVWHQNQMVKIEPLNGFIFQAESGGHTFEISGIDDSGNAVPISGTIAGVFLRPDNTDVALTGSASGGVASVTLKAECYAVPGRFLLTVYATSGSNKGTIYAAMGTVSRTSSGAVSPAAASDVVDLVNRINAATATIPASYTTLLNAVAGDYSDTKTYAVKDFVWYNGHLYRCTTAITTAETWTAAHWNQVVLSDALNQDITDLKSAIDGVEDGIFNDDLIDQFQLGDDGYSANPINCVQSFFSKVASTEDAPFFPLPMGEWHPVSNLSATYRYAIFALPSDLSDEAFSIGFWFKDEHIDTNTVRFSLRNSSNAYVADFERYVQSQLYVGKSQTKNDCVALVDKEINGWYHIKITIPASKGVAQLIVGADYFTATYRSYWSMPVIIFGDQHWFIKYKNKYYPAKTGNYVSDILYGKKVGWFGDSIMLGRHTSEDYGWYNNLRLLGCTVTVKALNGAMVSVKGAGYHSIISETAATVFDSDTDYLIFDGGANDYFNRQAIGTISANYSGSDLDTETYIGALEQVCYNLITNYPNSKLGYIIPYKMQTYGDIQGQKNYFDNAIEVCKKWGIPVLDMRYMCALNYNIVSMQQYFKDNVHINKSGYALTENVVAEWMRSL